MESVADPFWATEGGPEPTPAPSSVPLQTPSVPESPAAAPPVPSNRAPAHQRRVRNSARRVIPWQPSEENTETAKQLLQPLEVIKEGKPPVPSEPARVRREGSRDYDYDLYDTEPFDVQRVELTTTTKGRAMVVADQRSGKEEEAIVRLRFPPQLRPTLPAEKSPPAAKATLFSPEEWKAAFTQSENLPTAGKGPISNPARALSIVSPTTGAS
ncbi:MAG: hypothetical protein HQL88_08575, partial [Magnetococcales bacterium]|nr:hypothetical protein [Magnetococcales bacterium]